MARFIELISLIRVDTSSAIFFIPQSRQVAKRWGYSNSLLMNATGRRKPVKLNNSVFQTIGLGNIWKACLCRQAPLCKRMMYLLST